MGGNCVKTVTSLSKTGSALKGKNLLPISSLWEQICFPSNSTYMIISSQSGVPFFSLRLNSFDKGVIGSSRSDFPWPYYLFTLQGMEYTFRAGNSL